MDGDTRFSAYYSIPAAHDSLATAVTSGTVSVRIAETAEDLEMAFAVRACVFLAERGCRYAEEFDRNDRACSHLLVLAGSEPVGTLRLRWFAGFARFERMAIRREYRSLRVFRALVDFAMRLCAAKGYRAVVGLSRPAGVRFWKRFGGREVGPPIDYHGETLHPMRYEIPASALPPIAAGAVSAGNPAFEELLGRPESSLVQC